MRTILKTLTVLSVLSFSSLALAGVNKQARIDQIMERENAKIEKIIAKVPAGAQREAMILRVQTQAAKLIERIENLPSAT